MRNLELVGHDGGGAAPTRQTDEIAFGRTSLPGVRMPFARNEEIFGADEPADYAYRVVSGVARTMRFTADGRRQILAFHLPGDVFGLESGKTHDFSAEAVTDAQIVLVRRSAIDAAASNDIEVSRALLQIASRHLAEAQAHALVLGLKGAGERVASFLLKLADRATTRQELDLPMSRLDIADHLALTIETVSRVFSQMERDRAIALPSSRHVVMRNRGALEMLQAA
jgi:CRP/FNR family nitrogen fixation transcriptional regulator